MSSLDREVSGEVLVFRLDDERATTDDRAILERSGRNARTLAKQGPLSLTVVTLGPGGEIPEHHADGPISVQVLAGSIRFRAHGRDHALEQGMLLTLAAGEPHSVSSENGGSFLLTICGTNRKA